MSLTDTDAAQPPLQINNTVHQPPRNINPDICSSDQVTQNGPRLSTGDMLKKTDVCECVSVKLL